MLENYDYYSKDPNGLVKIPYDTHKKIVEAFNNPYYFKFNPDEDPERIAEKLALSNSADIPLRYPDPFKKVNIYNIYVNNGRLDMILKYHNKIIAGLGLPGFYRLINEAINNPQEKISNKNIGGLINWLARLSKLEDKGIKFPYEIYQTLKQKGYQSTLDNYGYLFESGETIPGNDSGKKIPIRTQEKYQDTRYYR